MLVTDDSELPLAKISAKTKLEEYVGNCRLSAVKQCTKLLNVNSIHIEKVNEAKRFIDAGYPESASDYPYITARSEAEELTKQVVADAFITDNEIFNEKNADIEKQRIIGKNNIDAATTIEDVTAAKHVAIIIIDNIPKVEGELSIL
jgi:prolyl oligopeptidase PreP (S9A serine peptidase family)